jgi:hypothetical protein
VTTKEKLKKMLTDRGMFDNQADEVLKEAIPKIESLTPDYTITWDRPADEYPDPFYNIVRLPLYDAAREWIAKNAPQAWFRPMFE